MSFWGNFDGRIIDNVGRVMRQYKWNLVPGTNNLQLNVDSFAKAVYFLQLKGKNISQTIPFIKL